MKKPRRATALSMSMLLGTLASPNTAMAKTPSSASGIDVGDIYDGPKTDFSQPFSEFLQFITGNAVQIAVIGALLSILFGFVGMAFARNSGKASVIISRIAYALGSIVGVLVIFPVLIVIVENFGS